MLVWMNSTPKEQRTFNCDLRTKDILTFCSWISVFMLENQNSHTKCSVLFLKPHTTHISIVFVDLNQSYSHINSSLIISKKNFVVVLIAQLEEHSTGNQSFGFRLPVETKCRTIYDFGWICKIWTPFIFNYYFLVGKKSKSI